MYFLALGGADHAGAAAYGSADRHVATGAKTEHPHPEGPDCEERKQLVNPTSWMSMDRNLWLKITRS